MNGMRCASTHNPAAPSATCPFKEWAFWLPCPGGVMAVDNHGKTVV